MFGGAYIRWEICLTKPIGLVYSEKVYIYIMCYRIAFAFFILYLRAISKYKLPGAYIRRGNLTEGFLRYELGGALLY